MHNNSFYKSTDIRLHWKYTKDLKKISSIFNRTMSADDDNLISYGEFFKLRMDEKTSSIYLNYTSEQQKKSINEFLEGTGLDKYIVKPAQHAKEGLESQGSQNFTP